jgi:hypothetical protein
MTYKTIQINFKNIVDLLQEGCRMRTSLETTHSSPTVHSADTTSDRDSLAVANLFQKPVKKD